jgi:hypothetical protein
VIFTAAWIAAGNGLPGRGAGGGVASGTSAAGALTYVLHSSPVRFYEYLPDLSVETTITVAELRSVGSWSSRQQSIKS